MQITDPIADLLTRIRNAQSARHGSVEIPASNMKKSICQICQHPLRSSENRHIIVNHAYPFHKNLHSAAFDRQYKQL